MVRRKANHIVVCDSSVDPSFRFLCLSQAIGKAQTDFGATVRFRRQFPLEELRPTEMSSGSESTGSYQQGLSIRYFALADIAYCDGTKGIMIYIKPTLFDDLPAEIYAYKARRRAFPHETTADQFFDEEQFEAYRMLGFEVGSRLKEEYESGGFDVDVGAE